jgi:hypothetical protein
MEKVPWRGSDRQRVSGAGQRGQGEGANRGKTESGNHDDLGMDCETASQGLLENGVQRNASRFETEKNDNIPLVTSDKH